MIPDDALAECILEILDTVPDPEIPAISITDLGIVRGVKAAPLTILITPTYTGCPAAMAIEAAVRAALDNAGFAHAAIETVLSPPWSTDWISERGRRRLYDFGISPPLASSETDRRPACPLCASRRTREVSRFSSTPCKALWRCDGCLEPFDHFKCH